MFKRIKIGWHKAKALFALQAYFEQALLEPLPAEIDVQLKYLSEKTIRDVEPRPVSGLNWLLRRLGRMFALRDQKKFYRQHHDVMVALENEESGE